MDLARAMRLLVGCLLLQQAGCGGGGVPMVPSQSLLVDLPTPAGWRRTADVPVSDGRRADLAIEPYPSGYGDPYALALTEDASGRSPGSLSLEYLDSLRAGYPDLVIDSSLSRTVRGNQGYLIQYRMPATDSRTVRELFFLWRQHDCRIVLSRFVSDTASRKILRRIEDGVILN